MGILLGQDGFTNSEANLKKRVQGGPLLEFLKSRADATYYYKQWHGVDVLTDWAVANSGGTSAANFAHVAATGPGRWQGDTGTTDNGSISLVLPIAFLGDQNAGMEVTIQLDDVTEANLEVGFIDAVPGSNASGVSDIDTPAATFTDGAIIQFDTDQTSTVLSFITDGGTANQDVAATALTVVTDMVNNTDITLGIQLVGNFAYTTTNGIIDANHHAGTTQAAGALEGGTLLAPWIYCRTRATATAKFPRITRVSVWQDWV